MLEINNLHARVDDKEILRGIDLTVNAGEVHAIMGKNGSGKSTLAGVLAGRDAYDVTDGEVLFEGKDLLDLDPEERAREGSSSPSSIPSRSPASAIRTSSRPPSTPSASIAACRSTTPPPFLKLVKEKMKLIHMSEDLLKRPVNEGFSGGEKKRNEIFQMAVLDPKLAILDETDSGLDIDALQASWPTASTPCAARSRRHRHHALSAAARTTSCPTRSTSLLRRPIVQSGGKELGPGAGEQGLRWLASRQMRRRSRRRSETTEQP